MQESSDLDVHRLADRMGVALPAYISFRNSPVWSAPSPLAEVPGQHPAVEAAEAAPDAAIPAAPAEAPATRHDIIDVGYMRNLMAIPTPEMPPAVPPAPSAARYPLIEAALAACAAGR